VSRLLDKAYGDAKRRKRIKVLINPFGGKGRAGKLYTQEIEPFFAAAKCDVDVVKTNYSGHASEIAQNLDIDEYDVLASASGDGLPYECFNGLAKKPNAAEALRKIAVVQLPCGSGNALSWNLNGTNDCGKATLSIIKGLRTPMDLVSITQGDRRTVSFLSQSLGIVAESDLGTDNLRWMGEARFTYGFLVRLLGKTIYPCDVSVKEEIVDKHKIKEHYARYRKSHKPLPEANDETNAHGLPNLKYGTVNDPLPKGWTPVTEFPTLGNFYCGNMGYMAQDAPFFPASLPCDGLLDLVMIDGRISRMKAIDLLLSVPKGTFFDNDVVSVRKISGVRVTPKYGSLSSNTKDSKKGCFAVDGETYPFEPFQIEVHQGLGTVLSRQRGVYECPGPTGWESLDI
jgi:sphingosine kinase